jgi:hypothetical protein
MDGIRHSNAARVSRYLLPPYQEFLRTTRSSAVKFSGWTTTAWVVHDNDYERSIGKYLLRPHVKPAIAGLRSSANDLPNSI